MVKPAALTLSKIRRLYHKRWNRDWPEDDAYLAELWNEARASHRAMTAMVPPPAVWDTVLDLMRESHEFEQAS